MRGSIIILMLVFAYEERTLLFAILAELIKAHLFPAPRVAIIRSETTSYHSHYTILWSEPVQIKNISLLYLLSQLRCWHRYQPKHNFWLYQLFAKCSLLDI